MEVNPADLRFTQDSIALHFKSPHEHVSIREALKKIQTGQMCPDDFPRLSVISHGGCLWSIDNRRLWVFRKGKCSQITVEINTTMHPRLEDLISLRSRYVHFSRAEFWPRVGKTPDVSPRLKVAEKRVHPRVAEVMARYGLAGTQGRKTGGPSLSRVASTNVHCGFKQPPPRRGLLSSNPWLVTTEGSVNMEQRTEGSNSSSSFPGSSGARHAKAVTGPRPTEEPTVDIVCSLRYYTETQERQSQLENESSARTLLDTPLLPPSANYHRRWFRFARSLICGCFGCE